MKHHHRTPLAIVAACLCCLVLTGVSSAGPIKDSGSVKDTGSDGQGTQPASNPGVRLNTLEFGGGYNYDGSNNWDGPYVRGNLRLNGNTDSSIEVARAGAFDASGILFIGGLNRYFSKTWSASFGFATSAGGYFLPAFSTDGSVRKRWLKNRRLETSVGFGFDRYKDQHNSYSWPFSVSYALTPRWRVEGGVSFGYSNADAAMSRVQSAAVSYSRDKKYSISVRGELGSQPYGIIQGDVGVSNYATHGISLRWRQWLRPNFGFKLGAGYNYSPYFQSKGAELGFFKDF